MAKLQLSETPVSLADHQITYSDGSNHALREKSGKVLLVNISSYERCPQRMTRLHCSVKATEKSSKDEAASALVQSPTPPA